MSLTSLLPRWQRVCATGRSGVVSLGALLLSLAFGDAVAAPSTPIAPGMPAASGVVRGSESLPAEVRKALEQAKLPADALALVIMEPDSAAPLVSWRPRALMNPASLTKLFTTVAALETLGPGWTWQTPVWVQGRADKDGRLRGDVVIKGSGDPSLVIERLWLLLRRLQQLGVQEIDGDIVLDSSAFTGIEGHPGDFDGDASRPYNVLPDALMLNYKSITLGLSPDAAAGVARVSTDAPLEGLELPASVPLEARAPCADWRASLQADFSVPTRVALKGPYPLACGEKTWPLAYGEPKRFNAMLVAGLWKSMGGKLSGRVREGTAPTSEPSFRFSSPSLGETVRDINKFSNNVMAQQLFLTLGLQGDGQSSPAAARDFMARWMSRHLGSASEGCVIENGSGLSRDNRVTAEALSALLAQTWRSPWMPELASALPVSGVDGTLVRSGLPTGRAHLKTGSLRDVFGLAGYVLAANGRRYVLVGLINHPQANSGRAALDAAARWTMAIP